MPATHLIGVYINSFTIISDIEIHMVYHVYMCHYSFVHACIWHFLNYIIVMHIIEKYMLSKLSELSYRIVRLWAPSCVIDDNNKLCMTLRWRHDGRDSISNHRPHDCLPNRLFRRRSKLPVTGLYAGNSPGTGEFPAQMASNAEKFPFHDVIMTLPQCMWLTA